MKKNNLLIIFFIAVLYIACKERNDLAEALKQASANRAEMEKVLSHYQNEPQKMEAAKFLIENMHGHYSYENQDILNRYYDEVDSITALFDGDNYDELGAMYENLSERYQHRTQTTEDIRIITSGFLIDNIERAFDVWLNGEWAKHLNFNDFCEYILPYKSVECQSLDNWREYLLNAYNGNTPFLSYCGQTANSAFWACYSVNRELNESLNYKIYINSNMIPVKRLNSLLSMNMGKCDDYNLMALSVMRAKGIPVAKDFTPQWPCRSNGHSWCVLLSNARKNILFDGASPAGINIHIDDPMAKIFRDCYAINKEVKKLNETEQFIPETFKNCFIKDVTDEYQQTSNVELKLKSALYKYAYLSVFDNANWVPIYWGKQSKGKVIFEKMGRDIIYLPVYYGKTGVIPAADPFVLTLQGEIRTLKADTSKRQTLTVFRKHPVLERTTNPATRIMGGRIQAANHADFRDSVTIYTISHYGTESGEILVNDFGGAYRYWRYCSPPMGYCNIAELYFFQGDSVITNKGKIIGTKGSWGNRKNNDTEAVFDSDPLTFFDSLEPTNAWVGLDFGKPVHVNKIIYVPRSDGNCVTYGDEYELMYWADNRWESLGKKRAEHIYLVYENCPSNALFLLHDCTRGKEDRIFTYEKETQIWW